MVSPASEQAGQKWVINLSFKDSFGPDNMTQGLSALVALAEKPGSILSIHVVAHEHS